MCCTCCKDGLNDSDVGGKLSWNRVRSEADLGGGIDAGARDNETKHPSVVLVSGRGRVFTFGSGLPHNPL